MRKRKSKVSHALGANTNIAWSSSNTSVAAVSTVEVGRSKQTSIRPY